MIVTSATLANAMLNGLLTALGSGTVALFASARPAAGDAPASAALATIALASPAGAVSTGVLTLAASAEGQLLAAGPPVWARVYAGPSGAWLFDCDARLDTDADAGQELVVTAPALYPGAFVRIAGGTLSL